MAQKPQHKPEEILGSFLLNENVSDANITKLKQFLDSYDLHNCKSIINAGLEQYYYRTSIHLAALRGLAPFLQILLQHGGNPNVTSGTADLLQTPLHLAAKGDLGQCIELLLKYGADLYKKDLHRNKPYHYIKSKPNCMRVVDHFFDEIKRNKDKLRKDILASMWKVREDGCLIKIRYGKVLLCGANGAGKTNFLNLLMREKFNATHISTQVAKPRQVTIAVKAKISMRGEEVVFEVMNIDDEIAHLTNYLPKQYKMSSQQNHPKMPDEQSNDKCKNERKPTITESTVCKRLLDKQGTDTSKHERRPTLTESIICKKISDEQGTDKRKDKRHSTLTEGERTASSNAVMQPHDEIWDILTFIDTGGQPQFISMLPVVNCSAMITFIVHKMTKGEKESLDDKFVVMHGDEKGSNSFKPYEHACTHRQLIRTLMSYASINLLPDKEFLNEFKPCNHEQLQACNQNRSISFIGTHSKGVPRCDIFKIDSVLTEIVTYSKSKNVKPGLNKCHNYLIPVDNKRQSESIGASVKKHNKAYKYTDVSTIRGYINKYMEKQDVYSVPVQWLLLELEIRKICNDKQCNFIAYSEVLKLGKEKDLGDEGFIKNGLRFHHLFGVLLYFEEVEGMCELVIVNHQWLFNKLTKIVLCSFNYDSSLDFEDLRKGIFKESMLNEISIDEDFNQSGIAIKSPKTSFIKLLQHLLIVASLKEDNTTKYFMPSLLESHNLDDLHKSTPGESNFTSLSSNPEPLLIQIKSDDATDSFPRGYFCFLVVQIIHSTNWELYKKNVYQNFLTFYKVYGAYYVTLIDKIFFLEVHISCGSIGMPPIHHKIFNTIKMALLEVGKGLNVNIEIKHGFLCRKCQKDTEEAHMTCLSNDDCCYCAGDECTQLESSHKVWLQKNEPINHETGVEAKSECSNAIKNIKANYVELTNLPIDSILAMLFAKEVITVNEKETIQTLPVRNKKMEYFLDSVIIPSVTNNVTVKFERFLKVMEESGDSILIEMAKRLCDLKEVTPQATD